MNRTTIAVAGAFWICLAAPAGATDGERSSPSAPAEAVPQVLKFTISSDGTSFTDTGEALVRDANCPDLVRLPNGHLLVVVDQQLAARGAVLTVMSVSRSTDDGRSWSPLRPVRVRDRKNKEIVSRHGDLLMMKDGRLRLFFTTTEGDGRLAIIRSAMSANGCEFRLDEGVRLSVKGAEDLHPTAATIRDRIHLYIAAMRPGSAGRDHPTILHYSSSDGRRFVKAATVRGGRLSFIGNIVSLKSGCQLFAMQGEGVASATSSDGTIWRPNRSAVLRGGSDPAVVALSDGRLLMLYGAPLDARSSSMPQLARLNAALQSSETNGETTKDSQAQSTALNGGGEKNIDGRVGDTAMAEARKQNGDSANPQSENDPPWPAFAAEIVEGDKSIAPVAEEASKASDSWIEMEIADAPDAENQEAQLADGFPPPPDFTSPIDYFAWCRQNAGDATPDNAYDSYATFMPTPRDPDRRDSWPEFRGPLNDANPPEKWRTPGPWDPAEHPEWEASNRAVQDLLAKFREAASHSGYAAPPETPEKSDADDGAVPMLAITLPHLSAHRTLAKATIDDAWRAEGGRVSPEKMIDSWRTVLRGADHMQQGSTLIEQLVGMSEQNLVEQNARWALKQGVIPPEQIESALTTLTEYDRNRRNSKTILSGEYAFAMDAVQYVFTPGEADGKPRINPHRVQKLITDFDDGNPEKIARIDLMTGADAQATVQAFDGFYRETGRQMEAGYPTVRAADLDATVIKYIGTNPITEMMTPAFSRAHMLRARNEASRRATQLSFAVQAFKAQSGRWPASLDELPAKYGDAMRTDPFTGGRFGYRVGADGPVIYSLSENGRDDGGVHAPRWNDEPTGGSDDFVFWPPQPPPKK